MTNVYSLVQRHIFRPPLRNYLKTPVIPDENGNLESRVPVSLEFVKQVLLWPFEKVGALHDHVLLPDYEALDAGYKVPCPSRITRHGRPGLVKVRQVVVGPDVNDPVQFADVRVVPASQPA